jgi:hypothetical protein
MEVASAAAVAIVTGFKVFCITAEIFCSFLMIFL